MSGQNDNDKTSLLNRAFDQIDINSNNINALTRITGEHSSSISILKKILIYILLFIVVSSLSMFFVFVESKIKSKADRQNNIKQTVEASDDKRVDEVPVQK